MLKMRVCSLGAPPVWGTPPAHPCHVPQAQHSPHLLRLPGAPQAEFRARYGRKPGAPLLSVPTGPVWLSRVIMLAQISAFLAPGPTLGLPLQGDEESSPVSCSGASF